MSLTQVKQPGNPVAQRTKVFVCHQGEFNESELDGLDIFEGLNLENIRLPGRDNRYANRLAEARAFFKPLPDDVNQIGFVSWRLSEKRGDGLSWKDIYRAVSRQNSSQVSGPYLWPKSDSLRKMAEASFPGMGRLVERLEDEFPRRFGSTNYFGGNSFVCSVEVFEELRELLASVISWDVWAESQSTPFLFKCHNCGQVSEEGHGRYRADRDIALFLEHATMYFFDSQVQLEPVGWVARPSMKKVFIKGRRFRKRVLELFLASEDSRSLSETCHKT